ncbi:hypothetical protein J4444_03495 [Candidatus Woesearchaeota archaeon]|nr:hypothetical protein [Candidatus Woesearchaeota archaeon]
MITYEERLSRLWIVAKGYYDCRKSPDYESFDRLEREVQDVYDQIRTGKEELDPERRAQLELGSKVIRDNISHTRKRLETARL